MYKKVKYELSLDEEDFVILFTDKEGRKRKFKLIASEGLVEYKDASGKRYLAPLLMEAEEE